MTMSQYNFPKSYIPVSATEAAAKATQYFLRNVHCGCGTVSKSFVLDSSSIVLPCALNLETGGGSDRQCEMTVRTTDPGR